MSPKAPRRSKPSPSAGGTSKPEGGTPGLFPHELRAGDVVIDETGAEWVLLGRPTKVVGAQELKATVRRVAPPADMRDERWRPHERVRVRRA